MALKIYRVLSFVLLPFGGLFAVMTLFMLLIALANPPLLMPVFMFACVAIYVFASFIFYNKGINQAKPCKSTLKDWIRVNAFVAVFFAVMGLVQTLTILVKPELMHDVVKQAIDMQKNGQSIPQNLAEVVVRGMLYFMFFFTTILLVHIILTFRFMKEYAHVFDEEDAD